jgi:hypothetical protein
VVAFTQDFPITTLYAALLSLTCATFPTYLTGLEGTLYTSGLSLTGIKTKYLSHMNSALSL